MEFDEFEASNAVSKLTFCEVTDCERVGDEYRITLKTPFGDTTHTMSIPTQRDMTLYRRTVISATDLPHGQEEFRYRTNRPSICTTLWSPRPKATRRPQDDRRAAAPQVGGRRRVGAGHRRSRPGDRPKLLGPDEWPHPVPLRLLDLSVHPPEDFCDGSADGPHGCPDANDVTCGKCGHERTVGDTNAPGACPHCGSWQSTVNRCSHCRLDDLDHVRSHSVAGRLFERVLELEFDAAHFSVPWTDVTAEEVVGFRS